MIRTSGILFSATLLLLFVIPCPSGLQAQDSAVAGEAEVLFDPAKPKKKMVSPNAGSEDDVKIDFSDEGIEVKIQAAGVSGYPGIQVEPSRSWNLKDYDRIEALITNKSAKPLYLTMRVDNDVPKVQETWVSHAVYLKPGETGPLVVSFAPNPDKPGYVLNPKEIVKLLIFTGNSPEEVTFVVKSLKAMKGSSGSPAKTE